MIMIAVEIMDTMIIEIEALNLAMIIIDNLIIEGTEVQMTTEVSQVKIIIKEIMMIIIIKCYYILFHKYIVKKNMNLD